MTCVKFFKKKQNKFKSLTTARELSKGTLRIFKILNENVVLTLAPIWFPHCPAWRCTISLIFVFNYYLKTKY